MSAAEIDLSRVRVGDVIAPGIVSCPPESSARDVAEIMSAKGIHCVVVTDVLEEEGGGGGWGVISDLDLASVATGDLDRVTAAEIAATEPVKVRAADSLTGTARIERLRGTTQPPAGSAPDARLPGGCNRA
jgi:CBS domain-containing protein